MFLGLWRLSNTKDEEQLPHNDTGMEVRKKHEEATVLSKRSYSNNSCHIRKHHNIMLATCKANSTGSVRRLSAEERSEPPGMQQLRTRDSMVWWCMIEITAIRE